MCALSYYSIGPVSPYLRVVAESPPSQALLHPAALPPPAPLQPVPAVGPAAQLPAPGSRSTGQLLVVNWWFNGG